MPAAIPAQLGRYEVIKRIGKGSMGLVYLARDPVIRRLVALKTFRMELTGSDRELEQYRTRFMREAQSAGILTHPNIVTIHDVVEESESGRVFIAMEYVRGANLKELLDAGERFDLGRIAEMVSQIASALDYAHEKGVVHRDIKPANVILDAEGSVKVTDFGIARLDSSDLTQEGQLLGTPNYMSPEQVLARSLDHRTDIFSLGVLLYELITVHKPFQGHNFTSVSHKIVYEDFVPPEQYVPELAPEIRSVLERALAKSPDDRFQQAGELADDLLISARLLDDPISRHSGVFTLPGEYIVGGQQEELANEADQGEIDDPEGAGSPALVLPKPPPLTRPMAASPTPSAPSLSPGTRPSDPIVVVTRERRDRREMLIGWRDRMLGLFRDYLLPVLTRRLGIAVAIVALLGVAAGLWVAWIDDGETAGSEMGEEHESRLTWVFRVRDARNALSIGDVVAASDLLGQVEGTAGAGRPQVVLLTQDVERQLQELEQIQLDATRIDKGLEAAQTALDDGRYEEAMRLAEAVLIVSSGQAEATLIVSAAQEGIERGDLAENGRSPSRRASRRSSVGAPTARSKISSRPAIPAIARVSLTFRSERAEGVLVISSGTQQLLRESFSFERTGVFKRRARGQFERMLEVPAGSGALRIHVSGRNTAPSSAVVEGEFSAGAELRLDVDFFRSGDLEARLVQ